MMAMDAAAIKEKLQKIWFILENPTSSWKGWLAWSISTVWTLTTILVIFLDTVRELKERHVDKYGHESNIAIRVLYVMAILGFIFGFVLRLVAAPNKTTEFLRDPLTYIDIFSFLPLFFCFFLDTWFGRFIGLGCIPLRLIRMVNDLNPAGLRIIVGSVVNVQVGTVLAVWGIFHLFFAVLIYMAELDTFEQTIPDLFSGLWFCTETMSTVGYGDLYPLTRFGRTVAGLSMNCGLLTLALLFGAIVNNYWRLNKQQYAFVEANKDQSHDKLENRDQDIEIAHIAQ